MEPTALVPATMAAASPGLCSDVARSRRRKRRAALAILLSVALAAASSLLISTQDGESSQIMMHRPITNHLHRLLKSHARHKDLLPLDTSDKLGFFFATLGLMIAAGGGIGGGGVLVPIYILVMRFSPKHAIPLSNITVFGGAVANTILNVRKRHPLADRPL